MKKEELIGKKVSGVRFVNGAFSKIEFTPIAMMCNKEQFNDIIPLLKSKGCNMSKIKHSKKFEYLTNSFCGVPNAISSITISQAQYMRRKVYHEWDKKIFLNACGIEWEEPTKEDKSRYLEPTEENLKEFEKSLDQSAEEFINDANRRIIDKTESEEYGFNPNNNALHKPKPNNPLDELPIIGNSVLMEVSNDGEEWVKRLVIAKYFDRFLGTEDPALINAIDLWYFARTITPKTKITRAEFEQKFEIID